MSPTKNLTNKTDKINNNTLTRMSTSKRPRAPIACIRCHHKKVRCDGLQPNCTRCTQSGVLCAYPSSRRSRNTQPTSVDPFIDNLSQLEIKIQQIEENLKSQRNLFLSFQMNNTLVTSSSSSVVASVTDNVIPIHHELKKNDKNGSKKSPPTSSSSSPSHYQEQKLPHIKQEKRSFQHDEKITTEKKIKKQRKYNKKLSNPNHLNNHHHYALNYSNNNNNNHHHHPCITDLNNSTFFQHPDWSQPIPTTTTTATCSPPLFFQDQSSSSASSFSSPSSTSGPFDIYPPPPYTDQHYHHHQLSPLTVSDYTDDSHGDTSSSTSSSQLMYFNDSTSPFNSYPQTPSLIPSTSESTTHSSISKPLNHLIPDPISTSTSTSLPPQSSCTIMDMYHFNMGNLMTFGSQHMDPIMNSTGWYC